MGWVKSMPGDVGDFSVNIGLGINFLAFVSQFVTLRDTLTYVQVYSNSNVGSKCSEKNIVGPQEVQNP